MLDPRAALAIRTVAAGAGVLYLILKVASGVHEGGLDFRLIWLAGDIWRAGGDPYAASFHLAYVAKFGAGPNAAIWAYPPYWYAVATTVASLPFYWARAAWTVTNAALLLASCSLVSRTLAKVTGREPSALLLEGIAFACFIQASPICLSIGQTSIILCFGVSLTFAGIVRDRSWLTTIGGVLLALKPNIGAVILAGVFALGPRRSPPVVAGALAVAGALPLWIAGSLTGQTRGFVARLSEYSDPAFVVNAAPNLTGVIQLADWLGASPLGPSALVLVAVALAVALGFARRHETSAEARIASFGALLSLALLVVPLHGYDMVSLMVLALIARGTAPAGWPWIAIGLLASFRPGNLVEYFRTLRPESTVFPESPVVTLALVSIATGYAIQLRHLRRVR